MQDPQWEARGKVLDPNPSMMPGLDSSLLIASVTLLLAALILICIVFCKLSKVKKARRALEKKVYKFHTKLIRDFVSRESSTDECDTDHEFCNCTVYRI